MKMLMSDYEVTLVNDNSMLVLPLHTTCTLCADGMLTELSH